MLRNRLSVQARRNSSFNALLSASRLLASSWDSETASLTLRLPSPETLRSKHRRFSISCSAAPEGPANDPGVNRRGIEWRHGRRRLGNLSRKDRLQGQENHCHQFRWWGQHYDPGRNSTPGCKEALMKTRPRWRSVSVDLLAYSREPSSIRARRVKPRMSDSGGAAK